MQLDPAVQFGRAQFIGECSARPIAGQIEQPEARAAIALQMPDHRQYRRDPDAAGDEQETGRARVQLEIVPRRTDLQQIANTDAVDQTA